MKIINIISLFNGMNTGRKALENAGGGYSIGKYYSSEIKPYAIDLTQHHYPDTIQLGDILNWKDWDIIWNEIDFVLSGSPCQDLSIAGKSAGIFGKESSLFWVFIEIKNHINEERKKVGKNEVLFFQENVGSASKKDVGIISRALGVYPARINSELVSAQQRDRYYWTNIKTKHSIFDLVTDIPQPKDRKISFQSILENGKTNRLKSTCLMERYQGCFYKDESAENAQKHLKNRDSIGMCPVVEMEDGKLRTLTKIEMCRLQGFPDNYCDTVSKKHAASLLGDGWNLPTIEHIFSFIDI